MIRRPSRAAAAALALGLALLGAARAGGAAVNVALSPADTLVAPGDTLVLTLRVTQPGSSFNGFEVVAGFDTAGLTLLPLDPTTLQQGCLVTGACSAACGLTFHRFEAAADSLAATAILLCDQVALTGPGALYRLRFRASDTPQSAEVRIRGAAFYDGGVVVGPVTTADAIVRIQVPVGTADDAPAWPALALRAAPNPARGSVVLRVAAAIEGPQRIEVFDVHGRRVRRIDGGWRAAGARVETWNGRDDAGRPLAPGVYVVALRVGGASARVRVALVR